MRFSIRALLTTAVARIAAQPSVSSASSSKSSVSASTPESLLWVPKHDAALEKELEAMLQRVQFDLNRAAVFETLDAETKGYIRELLEAEKKFKEQASTANVFEVFRKRMQVWQKMSIGRDKEIKATMDEKVLKHSRKFNFGLLEFLFERFLPEDPDGQQRCRTQPYSRWE
eukprot:g12804.t1